MERSLVVAMLLLPAEDPIFLPSQYGQGVKVEGRLKTILIRREAKEF
jgi:hypothetical protein